MVNGLPSQPGPNLPEQHRGLPSLAATATATTSSTGLRTTIAAEATSQVEQALGRRAGAAAAFALTAPRFGAVRR